MNPSHNQREMAANTRGPMPWIICALLGWVGMPLAYQGAARVYDSLALNLLAALFFFLLPSVVFATAEFLKAKNRRALKPEK